jgi:hypothetical protein
VGVSAQRDGAAKPSPGGADPFAERLKTLQSDPLWDKDEREAVRQIRDIAEALERDLAEADEDRRSYTQKLESATDDEVFRYLLLISTTALDKYIAQSRAQAEQSFNLAKTGAMGGFFLLVGGIGLGVLANLLGEPIFTPAYLSATAGAVTELIAGVLFYLYNRTLQQINVFHDKLVASQHVATAFLANSLVRDADKRDEQKGELAQSLILLAKPPYLEDGSRSLKKARKRGR